LVVSERPLVCDGLKRIIEEVAETTVTAVRDEKTAFSLAVELTPAVVVVDRPDIRATDLDCFFTHENGVVKVIVIGRNDDKIAVYSRLPVQAATQENFAKAIK
jgi:DNA-binding NarL/FixJ family response regulator